MATSGRLERGINEILAKENKGNQVKTVGISNGVHFTYIDK